jgi:hypothetical protein
VFPLDTIEKVKDQLMVLDCHLVGLIIRKIIGLCIETEGLDGNFSVFVFKHLSAP